MSDAPMQVRIYGSAVTEEGAREVGHATASLVNEVARSLGAEDDVISHTGEVEIACDASGCDVRRAWDSTGEGWTRTPDGHDYCPAHAKRPSRRQRQVLLVLRELETAATEDSVWHKGRELEFWADGAALHGPLRKLVEAGWATREGAPGTYAYTITPEGERALAHLERVG